MVKKKPAAQAKTAENETVKVETKAAEKTTAAEKEAVKEVAKEVVKETAAAEEAPAKAEEKPAAKAKIVKINHRIGAINPKVQKTFKICAENA